MNLNKNPSILCLLREETLTFTKLYWYGCKVFLHLSAHKKLYNILRNFEMNFSLEWQKWEILVEASKKKKWILFSLLQVCSYFKDPLVCIGPVASDLQFKLNDAERTAGEKRLTGKTSMFNHIRRWNHL